VITLLFNFRIGDILFHLTVHDVHRDSALLSLRAANATAPHCCVFRPGAYVTVISQLQQLQLQTNQPARQSSRIHTGKAYIMVATPSQIFVFHVL